MGSQDKVDLFGGLNVGDVINFFRYLREPGLAEYDAMTEKQKKRLTFKRWGYSINKRKKFKGIRPSTVGEMDGCE